MNQKEFENIAKQLRLRSLAVAHGFSFDTDEAEDVAQDAMLKLWGLHETTDNERWLEQRLKTLPSNEHAVLHLRQVERKTDQEIASILGISASSVPTLLSRARRKLLADIMRRRNQ